MGLETVTHISDLVVTNPVGSTDYLQYGDDHIKNIKIALKTDFPNITGPVTLTQTQINDAALKSAANTFSSANTFSGNAQNFTGTVMFNPAVTGGTTTAYTATLGETALTTNRVYECRVNATNTTASTTINFDSLGAKTIKLLDGNDAYIGALKIGMIAKLLYDGTNMVLLNPDLLFATGSWTPTILDASLSTGEGQTYGLRSGLYTRVNNLVTIHGMMTITSFGTLTTSQQARIGGLPFTSISTMEAGINFYNCTGMSITAGNTVIGYINELTNYIFLQKWSETTGDGFLLLSELTAAASISFSGSYYV